MTKEELHKILDDDSKKISLSEFQEILYRMKEDCFEQINVLDNLDPKTQWYYGEINAFYLALDLSEHIDRIDYVRQALEKEYKKNDVAELIKKSADEVYKSLVKESD